MPQLITIGFGTIGALAGVLIPFIAQLADASRPLGVSPQVWVTVGAVLATAVVLGRMGQAMAAVLAGQPAIDDSPVALIDEPPEEPADARPPA